MLEAVSTILSQVPKGFISALVQNGLLMTLAYGLVWKLLGKRLQTWRIQPQVKANAKQIQFELRNAVLVLLVGAVSSGIVFYLSTLGYTRLYRDVGNYGWAWAIASFFLLWIIDDAWFYWVHRLLHHRSIYRYVHAVHHHSIDVTPFSSMSFHVVEGFLLTAWIFPVALTLPIYIPTLGVLQILGLLNNIKAHLGYELYPASFNRSGLRFLTSSTHHNLHHSQFKGNYGLHSRFWDTLCGTEFKNYISTLDQVQARKQIKG